MLGCPSKHSSLSENMALGCLSRGPSPRALTGRPAAVLAHSPKRWPFTPRRPAGPTMEDGRAAPVEPDADVAAAC